MKLAEEYINDLDLDIITYQEDWDGFVKWTWPMKCDFLWGVWQIDKMRIDQKDYDFRQHPAIVATLKKTLAKINKNNSI